jgi:hypothetical protein
MSLIAITTPMRFKKPKKWKAWLVTWEPFYKRELEDIQRPRVVAILKPQLSSSTIRQLLPVIFISESRLTFSEKIGYGLCKPSPNHLWEEFGVLYCGSKPFLMARQVDDLYVERFAETQWRQKLHWTERPRYRLAGSSLNLELVTPAREDCEDVEFDRMWYGVSYLEEDRKRGVLD